VALGTDVQADAILSSCRRTPSVILASFGANLLSLAIPMAMIHIYDRVIPHEGVETLIVLGFVIFGALLAEVALRSARRYILERAGERFEAAAYPAAIRSILLADPAALGRFSQGELYRGLTGIDRLRAMHSGEISMALLDLPFAFLFLGVISLISPQAGLTIFMVLALSFLALRLARRRVLALQIKRKESEARRHSFLTETLRGLDVVKSMSIEDFMQRRYERLLSGSADISAETAKSVQMAQGFTAAVGTLSPLLMGSIGALMVIRGDMSVGGLAAVILLTSRIIQPILRVEAFLAGVQNTQMDREELEDILTTPPLPSGSWTLKGIDELSIENASTEISEACPIGFSNVTLTLKRGDCLALKGPDTQTKTAFLKLLAGELALSSGDIKVNGQSLFNFAPNGRRKLIRTFGRTNALIAGTLLENMTVFNPRRYRDRAIVLAQKLGIESSISQSPDGFEMTVGADATAQLPKSLADAVLIVGGLVTDPDVILFDEANASLDRDIDSALLALLDASKSGRITVLVSNRPSFLRTASRSLDVTPYLTAHPERASLGET
jgi:ATP-binding cassette subfamily C protein LapB